MLVIPTRSLIFAAAAGLLVASVLLLRHSLEPAPAGSPPMAPPSMAPVVPLQAEVPLPVRHVVALRDIPRGSMIDAAALGLAPVSDPPAEGFLRTDAVVGRVALERIGRGEALSAGRISPLPDVGGLAPLVPLHYRAVTLRVAEDTGVGFLIRPGDRVDVALVTRNDPEGREPNRGLPPDLSRFLLQDLLVLAVGDVLSPEAGTAQPVRTGPPLRNVTLAALPEQLLLLGLARGDGGYLLALRNPLDRAITAVAQVGRPDLLDTARPIDQLPTATAPAERPPTRAARSGIEVLRGAAGGMR